MKDRYKILQAFGKNVKRLCKKQNMTIEELAGKTGCTKNFLTIIEKGEAKRVCLSHVMLFYEALNTTMKELLK